MDDRLLKLYNRELQHVREMGAEFARQFPKIAGRLGMEGIEVADPYVERLLEGFAFLAARVQLQIDNEFPRFTGHLLEIVSPDHLAPTPSMVTVRIEPDRSEGSLASGPVLEHGTRLSARASREDKNGCIFTTAHDVQLWPIEIAEAEYLGRTLGSLDIGRLGEARAGVRLRIRTVDGSTFDKLPLDRLDLHIRGVGGVPGRVYEQLFANAVDVVVHDTARPTKWSRRLGAGAVQPLGFEPAEGMLPPGRRGYDAYRLLREYFAMPERLSYVSLRGLRPALEDLEADSFDITVLLNKADIELESGVSEETFSLFCTPAVNLFSRRIDRLQLDQGKPEHLLVPDRAAPYEYEIYAVNELSGFGGKGEAGEQEFTPFYSARSRGGQGEHRYYQLHRLPRLLPSTDRSGRRASRYAGSDVYVSLVDSEQAPLASSIRQLGGRALCTNRDLPARMPVGSGQTDFTLETGLPVKSIRCLGTPTAPRPSAPAGEHAWRLVNHLMPNYLSILDTDQGTAAESLREMLALYAELARPEVRQHIDGVLAVSSRPIVRRIASSGPAAFARGLEITLKLDELAFEGVGAFPLAAVLERFFAIHAGINVFTETVLTTEQRGEIKRWPTRAGLRPTI